MISHEVFSINHDLFLPYLMRYLESVSGYNLFNLVPHQVTTIVPCHANIRQSEPWLMISHCLVFCQMWPPIRPLSVKLKRPSPNLMVCSES